MYNEDVKATYLSCCKNKRNTILLFKKSERYEREAKTDLCKLSSETVKGIIANHYGNSIKSARSAVSVLKGYCRWCKDQGFDINYELLSIKDVDQSISTKKAMVSSPGRLQSILDIIFSKPEEETDECLMKCYLWCAFFGVPAEESKYIFETLKTDLDLDNLIITVADHRYEMYEESAPDFYNLKTLDTFAFSHPTYKKIIRRKRLSSDYLFRGVESGKNKIGHVTQSSIISRIGKKMRGKNRSLRYYDIYLSGVFYRAYQLEKEGFAPDFTRYLQYRFGDIDLSRLPRNSFQNSKTRMVAMSWYRDLLTNYDAWKKAFRLD